MFADLVGSTRLSELLELEQYYDLIAAYLECCDSIVREYQGFVAQHQGDSVLAYFGFPAAAEDDAERAGAAGLAIVEAVANIKPITDRPLETRVGIATGVVLVSDLKSNPLLPQRSVLGETPNLAARLQAEAAPGTVVLDGTTRQLLGQTFVCSELGTRRLKGFSEPVPVWQLRGMQRSTARFEDRQRGSPTPFVGRTEEVGVLLRRWRQAGRGDGKVVLVVGEPGIGKSRLTRVLCERVAGERHARVLYQCSLNRAASPLHPVVAQLELAAGLAPSDPPDVKLDKLEQLIRPFADDLPATARIIARLLSIPSDDRYGPIDLAPGQIKDATLSHLARLLTNLAAHAPVLVMFEDLHWIDPTTEEFLELLIGAMAELPVLLVGTARSEYTALWTVGSRVTTLSLARFDSAQAEALVESVLGGRRLDTRVVQEIVAKADGIPLFIEELTKSLLEAGSLRFEEGVYTFDGRPDRPGLPSTLQGSLLTRLDRLAGARDVAAVGAAIGRTFSYQLLRAVAGLDGADLELILERLVDAQLLFRRGHGPDATYSFNHALIQDVAYGTLLRSQRRTLHARIAANLRQDFPDVVAHQPEVLAHHYTCAGLAAEALEFRRRAAVLAIQGSANVEAIAHLQAALEQNAQIESADDRSANEIALRQMLCVPLEARSWGSKQIEENLLRLHQLIKHTGDQEALLSVLHGLCGVHILAGRLFAARKFARRMSKAARQGNDLVFSVLSARSLGMCAFFLGDLASARAHFDTVISLCDGAVRDQARSHYVASPDVVAHCMSAWADLLLGDSAGAERHVEAALGLVEARGHVFSRIYAFSVLASYHQARDDADAALRFATLAMALSRENNNSYWEAWAQIVEGWALAAGGEHDHGIAELTEGIERYTATGSRLILPYAQALLADACWRAGRIEDGLRIVRELDEAGDTNEVRFLDRALARTAGRLRAAAGQRPGSANAC